MQATIVLAQCQREVLRRTLRKCESAWPDLDPVQKYCVLQVEKACSKRSTALIVRLFSVFARSEAVKDTHFVSLRAVFLHQGSCEGHSFRPTGRNVFGNWMHL